MATDDTEVEGLARGLLNAIGEEALGETGGDRWKSGQPIVAPTIDVRSETGSPAPEPPAKEEKAPEKTEAEPEWFIPGSYKTREEAIKGIAETRKWASEGWDRVKAMEPLLSKPTPAPEPESDPLVELENFGVPRAALKSAIEQLSQQTVTKMFEPAIRKMEADRQIVSKYPEYQDNFDSLSQFVQNQPELLEKVTRAENAGEYLLARELAWLHYERGGKVAKAQELTAANTERVEKAKAVMADAAVVKPSATDSRTDDAYFSPNQIPENKFNDLIELAKAGYPQQLWKNTIGAGLERDYPSVFGVDGKI